MKTGWLDDDIISYWQPKFTKAQYISICWFSVVAVLAVQYAMEPQKGEFVQILNLQGNHWITVSNVGCQPGHINMYDSLHMKLSKDLKKLIADLLQHPGRTITVTHCNVQWQSGGSDCGVFAIAFATSICAGQDPTMKVFDQKKMRKHLITCLENAKMTPFPERSLKRARALKKSQEEVPVYCICRLPDDGKVMVQCGKCSEWYHTSCVQIPRKFLRKDCKEDYYCKCC